MAAHAVKFALVALLAAVALGSVAAQVTQGCSDTADTTVENGFFTMDGRCYSVMRKDAPGSSASCASRCRIGGLGCMAPTYVTAGGATECNALIDAYLASPANEASISNPGTSLSSECRLTFTSGNWALIEAAIPFNAGGCGKSYSSDHVAPCECTEAPVVTGVTAVHANATTVTVTGTTDTAGSVYCVVSPATTSYGNSASVQSVGTKVAVASAGAFTVTVTGVTTEGPLAAWCVGENGANEVVSLSAVKSDAFALGAWCTSTGCCAVRAVLASD